jgi:signal transduction histidine kinase
VSLYLRTDLQAGISEPIAASSTGEVKYSFIIVWQGSKSGLVLKETGTMQPYEKELFRKDGMPTWKERLQRVLPEDRGRFQAAIDRAIAEKSDFDVEFRILPPGMPVRFIHSVGHPVLGPAGEVWQFVGVAMDVTESRRAEEEREGLRQAQADLAHINRVSTMGELTASLAHEIKQPISAALIDAQTCLRWLARAQPDVAEAQEAASRVIKDVNQRSSVGSGCYLRRRFCRGSW